ncbi:MAG: enoyl-CoA hydratase/isomerase family protein [Rhodospirillaceae bacterium]|nr:enoyl-CoA hydratase/isomerase family protein [Rhodospirillaceae bacterium]MBT7293104.1 enoyl-CoA hydratase/isomerase family protein [Rhodospirillaceae bacterium]
MNKYADYETIAFERQDRILNVTINRPDVLNAVNAKMHSELARLFYDVAADEEADIIVLTGAGRAFCAGGDLDWLQAAADDPALFTPIAVEAKQIIFGLLDCEKPIICRLNGDAIGLGATMALFCDIIIASETARIGDLHVNVGLVAGDGGAIIWPQLIGYPRAKEFLMTGKIIDGREAAELGLINHAVPPEELDARTEEIVRWLDSGATMAVRLTKAAVNVGLKQLAHGMMDASIAYETLTNTMPDHQEGLAAFRERRKPKFGGG